MLKWLEEAGHEVSLFAFSPTAGAREPHRRLRARGIHALGVSLIGKPRRSTRTSITARRGCG